MNRMSKSNAAVMLLTGLVLLPVHPCLSNQSSTIPSELARDNFNAAHGLCWLVDMDKGWPVLGRAAKHLPLDTYRGSRDAVFTVSFADSTPDKPQIKKDGWDHLQAVYPLDAGQAVITVSRLSPAVLFESPGHEVTFTSSAGPDYVAFSRGGKPVVHATSELASLSAEAFSMDEPWVLGWFCDSTPAHAHIQPHDVENERGVTKGPGGYNEEPSKVDMPVLFRLEHRVSSIRASGQQGLVFHFTSDVGKLAVMPLAGGRIFLPAETKTWAEGLPADVVQECRRWSARLTHFPVTVAESFVTDPAAGTVTIKQQFRWISFEDDWHSKSPKAAPIPPPLALAYAGGAAVKFFNKGKTVTPVDCGFMDAPGLVMLIEDTDDYEYRVSDLNKLLEVRDRRQIPDNADAKLMQEKLERHVAQMVDAGHLAPLLYIYGGIGGTWFSHLYWGTSPELAQALMAAYPYLSNPLQAKVVEYLKSEWQVNPPLQFNGRRYLSGEPRMTYELPLEDMSRHLTYAVSRESEYRQSDYSSSLYGVDAYLRLAGVQPDSALRDKSLALVRQMLSKQDWAIMGPDRMRDVRDRHAVFYYNLQGAATYNRWLAGAIGFTRMARRYGWAEEEKLGCYLMAKLAMARIAQAHYVAQMYQHGLVQGQADRDNRAVLHIDTGCTVIGRGPMEVGVHQNQETPPFNDLVEEVGRLLGSHARAECKVYLDHLDYSLPFWYISEAPKEQATEQRTTSLQYYNGNVLAQYWILGKRQDDFTRYIDTTRFLGDLYYIQNLAAGIDSYTATGGR